MTAVSLCLFVCFVFGLVCFGFVFFPLLECFFLDLWLFFS